MTFESRIIAFAERFLSARTFELIVEPALADFHYDEDSRRRSGIANRVAVLRAVAGALGDLLPRDFLARPKMGFTLPFEKWLQQNLRHEVSSVLEDAGPIFNPKALKKIWRDFLDKPRAVGWSRPWSLYVLAKWCEINSVTSA